MNKVYSIVNIPPQARDELYRVVGNKPIIRGTTWIKFMVPSDNAHVARLAAYLDPGESEAIALALGLNADYLIIDEYQGRAEATKLGIPIVGLLGDLIAAKKSGHISAVQPHVEAVIRNGFRLNTDLVDNVLRGLGEK